MQKCPKCDADIRVECPFCKEESPKTEDVDDSPYKKPKKK